MDRNFDAALAAVLRSEGGYVNDPIDPGGATNKGITQRVYTAYRRSLGLEPWSVKLITDAEVRAIYQAQYWVPCRCCDLPDGLDYAIFDGAVNSGCVRSIQWLQQALKVPVDGHIGLVTLQRAKIMAPAALVPIVLAARLGFLKHLPTWWHFGRGWKTRVDAVQALALKMASGGGR